MEKGLLSKDFEKIFIKTLDKWVDAKGLVEPASDWVFKHIVPAIDDKLGERVRDSIKLPLRKASQLYAEGKIKEASEHLGLVLVATIDIKGVDETDEERWAKKLFNLIADILQVTIIK